MKITCPHCGASFEAEGGIVTCPYCGFKIKIGEAEEFIFPLKVQNPWHSLISFVRIQSISPNRVEEKAQILTQQLYYIPFYLFFAEIEGSARHGYLGKSGACRVEFFNYITVPAVKGFEELVNYPLPTKGREYFDRGRIKGQLLEREISEDEAKKMALKEIRKILKKEAEKYFRWSGVDVGLLTKELELKTLVYYPIWEITYKYGFFTYKAYVDGVDDRIPYAEFPISEFKRILNLALASVLVASGIVIGKAFMGIGITAPFGSMGTSLFAAYPSLRKALRIKGRASEHKLLEEVKDEIMPEAEAFKLAKNVLRSV